MSSRFAHFLGTVAAGAMLAGPAAADESRMKVVTTFTVLADMARNVAGDAADVVSITVPGAEIHEYEPTPRDIVRAQDADLILSNGLGLERWFQKFLDQLGDLPSAEVSAGIEPLSISGGEYDGKPNPHAWMGLENAVIYVDNMQAALAANDPDNAEAYAANADAYKEKLRAELDPLRAIIAAVPEENRWLVSCEGAFSYLARDLDMQELFLWPVNADQTGTPKQVKQVIDGVREHDVPAVFCESTVNSAPAKQVARETGAAFGGILYVDSLSKPDGPVPTYLDLLRVTTETIARGLSGAEKDAR
ncbi:metal ABC transporter substrate-binding protein [Pontibaca methylaminivorans]|uniref:Manganese/iron transport system substrate-binding protein n=1 Tax=Pontibaca methylaminivorans TaxID=515897 RepID=A0A1R3WRT6_9RHOB|nr:metal ABC transporter substrate-binding protein [Pontibaca methylaminivorans]SIT81055.1 manganese/iron transport system substrate-binding protein [Pontibaca methylaminivorans]